MIFIKTGVMLNRVSHPEITYDLNYMGKVHDVYTRFCGSVSQALLNLQIYIYPLHMIYTPLKLWLKFKKNTSWICSLIQENVFS